MNRRNPSESCMKRLPFASAVVLVASLLIASHPADAVAACASATKNQSTTHDTPFYPGQVPSCARLGVSTGHNDSASCPADAAGVYSNDSGGDVWINYQSSPNDQLDDGTYTTYWNSNSGSKKCGSYVVRSSWNSGSCAYATGAVLTVTYGVDCAPACSPQQGQTCESAGNSCGMKNSGIIQCNGSCNASAPSDALCPLGSHDVSSCSSVAGWGFDPEYAGKMQVHIYQKPSGGNSTFLIALTADQSRPDVGAAYPGRTDSGWSFDPHSFPVLMDGMTHDIYAYAINVDASGAGQTPNPMFGNSPKPLACTDPPFGTLAATCGSVSGTASDNQGSPVVVRIREQVAGTPSCITDPLLAGPVNAESVFGPVPFIAFTDGKVHSLTACAVDVPSGQQSVSPFATAQVSCPPAISLTPGASSVNFGESTTIAWNVSNVFNPADCTASPAGWFDPNMISAGSGAHSVSTGPLTDATTYSLSCTNEAGTQSTGTATISVNVPPPEASVIDVRVPPGGYCAGEPVMDIEWGYSSAARKISAYQVQVLLGGSVVYDSAKVSRTAFAAPENAPLSFWTRSTSLLASVFSSLLAR
jgi:hypothetical protein